MSTYVETPTRTFSSDGTAIGQHLRVKLSSGVLALAGATDKELGTTEYGVLAGEELATVRLRNAPGTKIGVAAGAITAGSEVYTAAAGKYDDTQATGAFYAGTALTAATADGDLIEILPPGHGDTAGS
jgi:hypothetical protein